MKTIQIYSDETKSANKSFMIYSMIYGSPPQIDILNKRLKSVIHPENSIDSDFKGLHAYNLNEKNWHKTGKKYENSLDILENSIINNEIGIKISIIGIEKYNQNVGALREILKKQLLEEGSPFQRAFKNLNLNDHPALYYRLDHLLLFFIYRDRIASSETNFELYPDSSGKILSYKNRKFLVTGKYTSGFVDFYSLVKLIGNLIAQSISKLNISGWSHTNQMITKYEPLKSSDSYIIQACDMLANFLYCHLRHKVGIGKTIYELKSNALMNRFGLKHIDNIIKNFDKRNGDVYCNDSRTAITIDFDSILLEESI